MSHRQYLREQAELAQHLADTATLPNVRTRYLRSADVWRQLLERAERLELASGPSGIGRSPRLG